MVGVVGLAGVMGKSGEMGEREEGDAEPSQVGVPGRRMRLPGCGRPPVICSGIGGRGLIDMARIEVVSR